MKVKLLVPLAAATGAYNIGDEYPCVSAAEAQRLVAAGYAEHIRSVPVEKAVKRTKTEQARK